MAINRPYELPSRNLALHAFILSFTLTALAFTSGCVGQGIIYTRVVSPYSNDFRATPSGTMGCRVSEHILREPVSGVDVSVSYTLRVLYDAANEVGMTNIYFADLETFSILNGLYERKMLILYGD